MGVRIKDHIGVGAQGQPPPREMCFDTLRRTVSLNPKDKGW